MKLLLYPLVFLAAVCALAWAGALFVGMAVAVWKAVTR